MHVKTQTKFAASVHGAGGADRQEKCISSSQKDAMHRPHAFGAASRIRQNSCAMPICLRSIEVSDTLCKHVSIALDCCKGKTSITGHTKQQHPHLVILESNVYTKQAVGGDLLVAVNNAQAPQHLRHLLMQLAYTPYLPH